MRHTPPFTITAEILNQVAHISELVGRLDASGLHASPRLRKQNAPVCAPVCAPVNPIDVAGLKTPEAIVALLKHDPTLTRKQLADAIGKDIRTIARALTQLKQAGKMKRVGSAKTGHWEVF